MSEKTDLQAQAEELGVDFTESDTIAVLKEKIDEVSVPEERAEVGEFFAIEFLEANCQALFGQPRSVFVGAKSAGFITGPTLTKEQAAEGVQKFLNFEGGS
jgi:hypothetical protein